MKISVQNYKSLANVELELGRMTVLVGPNGSGKSSILEAIEIASLAAAGALVGVPPSNQLTWGSFTQLMEARDWDSVRAYAGDLRVAAHIGTSSVRFTLARSGRFEVHAPESVLRFPGPIDQSSFVEAWRNVAKDDVPRFECIELAPSAEVIRRPVVAVPQPLLHSDGSGLADVIQFLLSNQPEVMDRVITDASQVLGMKLKRVRTPRESHSEIVTVPVRIGNETIEHRTDRPSAAVSIALEYEDGKVLPAKVLSTGTLTTLALLVALHSTPREGDTFFLLDDVGSDLHPKAQDELMRAIARVIEARPDVHFVCTTHSPYVVDAVKLEDVRVLALDEKGHTQIGLLTEHEHVAKWREVMLPGEFWSWAGEDWVAKRRGDA